MLRRWLIRSLFLLPLVCVVGLWVTSYFGGIGVVGTRWRHEMEIVARHGITAINEAPFDGWRPFEFTFDRKATAQTWDLGPTSFGIYRGGFISNSGKGGYTPYYPGWLIIVLPLWFPTLLLVALNWFVWRKTKAKPKDRAFPIEPTAKAEESKS